jgi:hypothetical protein
MQIPLQPKRPSLFLASSLLHWSWGLVLCNEIVLKLKYNNVEWWPSIRNFGLSYCYVFTELKL